MNEKLRKLKADCDFVFEAGCLICILLIVAGSDNVFLAGRIISATIAGIACAIACGIEIANNEKYVNNVVYIAICVLTIIVTIMMMI